MKGEIELTSAPVDARRSDRLHALRRQHRGVSGSIAVAAALALSTASSARAVSSSTPIEQLQREALALDKAGDHPEAARRWESAASALTDDAEARMFAYFHAANAWIAAYDGAHHLSHLCAARSIVARALADAQLDDRARSTFQELKQALDARGGECPETASPSAETATDDAPRRSTVALLEPHSDLNPAPRPLPTSDTPRRSPHRIAGAVSLALAAPALGGLTYAFVRDAQIARQLDLYTATLKAGGHLGADEDAHAKELGAEAFFVRGLGIGLGLTSAALLGAGVGLVVHARRRSTARSLALLPDARPGLAGVALWGRF
ncbi:MAG: hypothetical protein R3B09_06540 [Nannocystaceae bacterium]